LSYTKDPWTPQYETEKGSQFNVSEVEIDECPTSFITSESKALIELHGRLMRGKDAVGAAMFGPDSGAWPAWWLDLISVLEVQKILESNARQLAMAEEMRNAGN
jgi:hypothetical protein